MFEWFKGRKKKVKKEEKKQPKAVEKKEKQIEKKLKATAIKYNPILIDTLVLEHKKLLQIYTEVLQALSEQDFVFASKKLTEFGQGLRAHLLREHVELYVYLEYVLANDADTFKEMHALRVEMDGISAKVMGFLHAHEGANLNDRTVDSFRRNFIQIGKVLTGRIEREEKNLYTLYQPS